MFIAYELTTPYITINLRQVLSNKTKMIQCTPNVHHIMSQSCPILEHKSKSDPSIRVWVIL